MWFKGKKKGGPYRRRERGTAPFKKIIRTNRSLCPEGGRGAQPPFKKVIRNNHNLCPEKGEERGARPHSKR